MTEFLVKHFVKQYEQTEKEEVRTSYGVLASMVGICCNILLFAAKLFIGLLVNSVSVMADAFNNLSDAASSIIGFIGVRMAGKPADDDHPFGHGRIEYISAFIVAFLVIQVGFSLFKSSVGKILHPEDMTFKWISVIILLLSIGVKFWLSAFNRKLGMRINSKVMLATASRCHGRCDHHGSCDAFSGNIWNLGT
jgi:cation diffusion facilitator family transporter